MKRQPTANLQRQGIATVILLAMLVAPLCAPLCGSRACENASARTQDCHNSVTANPETQEASAEAVRACALGELPTAALNETATSAERTKQFFGLHASAQFLVASHGGTIAVNSTLPAPDNEPYKTSSVQAAVLRL